MSDNKSKTHNLGRSLGEFPVRSNLKYLAVGFTGAGILFSVPGVLIALYGGSLAAPLGIPVTVCGSGCLAIGATLAIIYRFRNRARYMVFQNGIAYIETKNPATIIRWSDLHEFRYSLDSHIDWVEIEPRMIRVSKTILLAKNGASLEIGDNVQNGSSLTDLLWRLIAEALVPEAIYQLEHKKTLEFGALRVTKSSISKGKREVDWANVDGVYIKAGHLIVRTYKTSGTKELFRMKTSNIPNLPVLLALLESTGPIKKLQGPVVPKRDLLYGFDDR